MSFADDLRAETWRADAACLGSKPDRFDTLSGNSQLSYLTKARPTVEEFCLDCPVLAECRRWADSEPEFTGIAAGRVYYSATRRDGRAIEHSRSQAAGTRRYSIGVWPRPELPGFTMRYLRSHPVRVHLVADGTKRALCGQHTDSGDKPDQIEKALVMPRCTLCQKIAPKDARMPVRYPQEWSDKIPAQQTG